MKLRNKKTGEIVDFAKGNFISSKDYGFVIYKDGGRGIEYSSLTEFNKEWEDYEEPKEDGLDNIITLIEAYSNCDNERYPKEIVEKLKAWQRLKDKGFRFEKYEKGDYGPIIIELIGYVDKEADSLLDLLFGGEE